MILSTSYTRMYSLYTYDAEIWQYPETCYWVYDISVSVIDAFMKNQIAKINPYQSFDRVSKDLIFNN